MYSNRYSQDGIKFYDQDECRKSIVPHFGGNAVYTSASIAVPLSSHYTQTVFIARPERVFPSRPPHPISLAT